jgi:hypothetical protein
MKVIIGIGDSWTQGQGGYPEHIIKEYNGHVELPMAEDHALRTYEFKNTWVTQLCDYYLTDHTPIIQGRRGIGNRAAVRQLYFIESELSRKISGGYLIFLLSSWDRFDFFKHQRTDTDEFYQFRTMFPGTNEGDPLNKLYTVEAAFDINAVLETMCSIIEAQNFAVVHNLKFIFANSFSTRGTKDFQRFPKLLSQIQIENFVHNHNKYESFDDMLYKLEKEDGNKYHASCHHPNIDGYRLIAKEFYEFIENQKNTK